jgi:peptidoglycan/xylan/chitin deacetylase (PgdA/CDA1 family)
MTGSGIALVGAAAGGLAVAGTVATMIAPRCRLWGPVVCRAETSRSAVALTFDDGPTPGATDRILDVLGSHGVKAAFFVVGANVERHPQLLRRIHAEGHQIANHSYRHSHYGFMRGWLYWRNEIARTDAIVEQTAGVRPAMFRPPMGIKSLCIAAEAARAGHVVVTWSLRAWDGIATTPQQMLSRVTPRASGGDIVLLHDGVEPNARRDPRVTVQALPELIGGLRAKQLEPTRLDALTWLPAYQRPRANPARNP